MSSRFALLVACLLGLGACTRPYTPKPGRVMEPITEFTASGSILLRNVQSSTTPMPLKGLSYTANYAKWTDVAIEIAERELTKRGMQRSNDATKSLDLSIVNVEFVTTAMTFTTNISMRVEAGNGHTAAYTGSNKSWVAAYIPAQIDGALTRVVREMLNDPAIVAYLTG
jgi:hypothetical protein